MIYLTKQTQHFIKTYSLESYSDAFKQGLNDCFMDLENNIDRLSSDGLVTMFNDRLKRAYDNLKYAPTLEAEDFQRGFIIACKSILRALQRDIKILVVHREPLLL